MSARAPLRFVFMADCQLGAYASFSGLTEAAAKGYAERGMTVRAAPAVEGFAWDAERYRRAIAATNRLSPDFVVMGGDMLNDPRREDEYDEVLRITGRLRAEIPMYWVPGNHDVAFDGVVPTTDSVAAYRRRFGPDAYAFDRSGVGFVVVNTVIWDHPEEIPGSWEAQMAFLEGALVAARGRGNAHIIVFAHHPLFTASPDEDDSYWNIAPERRSVVLDLLAAHRVSTVFSGHWHRNGGGMAGDTEVVVSGPVGYPLGTDPSGLRIVEVSDGAVEHRYVSLHELDGEGEE
jgi:3',5'-cyclic AMP phosphodiesterase CpdA